MTNFAEIIELFLITSFRATCKGKHTSIFMLAMLECPLHQRCHSLDSSIQQSKGNAAPRNLNITSQI